VWGYATLSVTALGLVLVVALTAVGAARSAPARLAE